MNSKFKRIIAGTLSSAIIISQTGCTTKNTNNNYNKIIYEYSNSTIDDKELNYGNIESYIYSSPLKSIINSSFNDNTKCSYNFDNNYMNY